MNRPKPATLIPVLGLLTAIGPFSIDMYLPGFPAIAADLHTDISHVAFSLTSYFIGISIGQLAYGPLLDRYGRRRPLIAGLLIYIVAAGGCGLSPTIDWLIAQRLLLALGGCVGIVAARAIVRDLFSTNEVAHVFSTLMLILGVSPILAPSVGAYVSAAYSWRYIFGILGIIASVILVLVVRYLPESRAADESISLRPLPIVRDYAGVFREPQFIIYGIASASASAGLFSYIADAPFVFMKLFGFGDRQFGWLFSLSACGVIGASQVNKYWLKRRTSISISKISATAQTIVTALLLCGVFVGVPSWGFMVLLFGYLVCVGFLSPNTTALAITPFRKFAGTASALMGSMQMAAGAIGSALVSYFHSGTAMPMAALLFLSSLVGLIVQLRSKVSQVGGANANESQFSVNEPIGPKV